MIHGQGVGAGSGSVTVTERPGPAFGVPDDPLWALREVCEEAWTHLPAAARPAERPGIVPPCRYRVAVLGEHTAKALLLDDCLGVRVLEPFLGGRHIILVAHGGSAALRAVGGGEARSPDRETWEDLDAQAEPQVVQVRVPASLLHELDLALVALPGPRHDLGGERGWPLLQSCHAAVLVVDAPSMITRAQLDLLHEIAGRHGPMLLGVVVVGLEDVEEPERDAVTEGVARYIRLAVGELPVVSVAPGERGGALLASLLRAHAPAQDPERRVGSLAAATAVAEAEVLLGALAAARQAAELQEADVGRAAEELHARWRREDDEWADRRLEIRAWSARVAADLRGVAGQELRLLQADLAAGLATAADPRRWYDDELVHHLHRGLVRVTRVLEDRLVAAWVGQVARVGAHLPDVVSSPAEPLMPPDLPELGAAADLLPSAPGTRVRLLARLGVRASLVLGPTVVRAFGGSMPNVDSFVADATALTDSFFDRRFTEDRQQARAQIAPRVRLIGRRAGSSLVVAATDAVARLAAQLIEEIDLRRTADRTAAEQAISAPDLPAREISSLTDRVMAAVLEARGQL
jgi:hypothetical protein